jgi:hypothetical protein
MFISSMTRGGIALDTNVWDYPVEDRVLIAEAMLTCGQFAEVLSGFWDSIVIEFHHDSSSFF